MTTSASTPATTVLRIDSQACDGVGMCAHLAPTLIALDHWGYPIIPQQPLTHDQLDEARKAVKGCPKKALHLVTI